MKNILSSILVLKGEKFFVYRYDVRHYDDFPYTRGQIVLRSVTTKVKVNYGKRDGVNNFIDYDIYNSPADLTIDFNSIEYNKCPSCGMELLVLDGLTFLKQEDCCAQKVSWFVVYKDRLSKHSSRQDAEDSIKWNVGVYSNSYSDYKLFKAAEGFGSFEEEVKFTVK